MFLCYQEYLSQNRILGNRNCGSKIFSVSALISRQTFSVSWLCLSFDQSFISINMNDTLLQQLCNSDYRETEARCLALDDKVITERLKEANLSVFAHINGGKPINLDSFKTTMGKDWWCGSFSIQKVDNLFYQIWFGPQETTDFVLANGSWNFENN